MENPIICARYLFSPDIGRIIVVHEECFETCKHAGVSVYRCSCCNETFRGGTHGVREWSSLPDLAVTNYSKCTYVENDPCWYIRQVRFFHLRNCQNTEYYNDNMKPILQATCHQFGLKSSDLNFKKITDAAVLGVIHKDIQEIINNQK